jgi:uncharacterized protein (TIGR03083 family)
MMVPEPVLVADLFPAERAALLDLLGDLTQDQWALPTSCAGWSVHDVVAHLLADDLGKLSGGRDGHAGDPPWAGEDLLTFINRRNAAWVGAMRRLSPRVLCDLLAWSGPPVAAYFGALDPFAMGGPVSWAGPQPAPVWLDIAREYTERWHHQQHIRAAVGRAGLTGPRFLAPVLATFARALTVSLRETQAPAGTAVHLQITGASGGAWTVVRVDAGWVLYSGTPDAAAASVTLDEIMAWRLFTRGLTPREAARHARLDGDAALGQRLLHTVAIIA